MLKIGALFAAKWDFFFFFFVFLRRSKVSSFHLSYGGLCHSENLALLLLVSCVSDLQFDSSF